MRILKDWLEAQCLRVDAVLAQSWRTGKVIGGIAGPEIIRLYVQGGPYVIFREIAACRDDLAQALGAPELRILRATSKTPGTATLIFDTPAQFRPGAPPIWRARGLEENTRMALTADRGRI